MSDEQPLLKAVDLTRVFGHGPATVRAVDEVSLEIRKGEALALVGESGSGKSTLARLLLRLLPATSGSIAFQGADVTRLRGGALRGYWRDVQAVFQDPFSSFNQFFTVEHIFRASLRMLGNVRRDLHPQRVERALAAVGLGTDVLGRWPHQLSGGQRQRVMMARALLTEPRLLIADEPTSMLDASLRATILNLLRDVREEYGMAVLFITHDVGQACYLSDRLLVMRLGRLVESGRTEDVVEAPQHEYTKQLLADVPRLARRAG
ncbi:MAG: ABC transporter ATP-binding protein [Candidatus Dormibacteraeota bacterium]|nr:ABC transporter ATP-binding protein [Candidatus Dormibacteraeota bacterium]